MARKYDPERAAADDDLDEDIAEDAGDDDAGDADDDAPHEAAIPRGPGVIQPRTDDPCPVTPLGVDREGRLVYMTPSGRLVVLAPSKHGKQALTALFEVDVGWLWDAFPTFAKQAAADDQPPRRTGWNAAAAAEWLMVKAADRGMVDVDRSLRGPGTWRGADGGLIVHMGDALWIGPDGPWATASPGGPWSEREDAGAAGEVVGAGRIIDGFIYPAWPAEPRPAFAHPATTAEAQDLLELAGQWAWKAPDRLGPLLWLGFIAASCYAGALTWRPHLRVIGDAGMGKTELENLGEGVQGGERVIERVSDPTPAYIRQALGPAARPVAIDESEPDPRSDRSDEVLKTIRMASSDRQAPVGRGGQDGQPSRQYLRCCVYLSAILPSRTLPQDRTRLTQLELADLPADADTEAVLAGIARMTADGPRFRARLLLGWGRFQQNLVNFQRALAGRQQTRRLVDQVGTLLAAAATLLSDGVADPGLIEDWVGRVLAFLEQDPAERDHDECLGHLLSVRIDPYRHGDRHTLGDWIEMAKLDTERGIDARRALPGYGLKVVPNTGGWKWLLVANAHNGLSEVFRTPEPTRWAGGAWKTAMARLPGALEGEAAAQALEMSAVHKFAGKPSRYVAVPRAVFGLAVDPAHLRDDDRVPPPPGEDDVPFTPTPPPP